MSLAIQRLQARLNPTAKPSEPAPTPMAPAAFLGERMSDRAAEAALDAVKANMARVVPPDAPKKTFERKLEIQQPTEPPPAEPSLAAQVAQAVVEHAAQVAQAVVKRGPGRPPGAKNKPKAAVETLLAGAAGTGGIQVLVDALKPAPVPEKQAEHYTFKTVTVSMTGKLNMGHYQSLDIHVSQTMEYAGSPDEAFTRCAAIVKSQLDAALENVVGRKVEDPVPADVLASTKR